MTRQFCIAYLLLFAFHITWSQEEKMKENLSQQLQKAKSASDSLLLYQKIGAYNRDHSLYSEAVYAYMLVNKLAHQTANIYSQAESNFELGIAYLRMSDRDSSRIFLHKALEINKTVRDSHLEASINNMLGNVAREDNNYNEALQNYIKATELFEQLNDPDGLTQSVSNIGNIYYLMREYKLAEQHAERSLQIAQSINKKSSIAYSNRLLGRIYRKQERFTDAMKVYKEAIKSYKELEANRDIGETYLSIGNIYFEMGNLDLALQQYFSAIQVERKIRDTLDMAYAFSAIAMTYGELKQDSKMINYYDSALLFSNKAELFALKKDLYYDLSFAYADRNNFRKAHENLMLYDQLKDSLLEIEHKKQATELAVKYENDLKEAAIESLNSKNQIQELQLKQRRTERYYLIGLLLLFMAFGLLLYNRYRLKAKTNRRLEELDQLKSRFFTNISHEFRTPLSLILGPLEKMLESPKQIAIRELEMTIRNARILQSLINQLLDLSRLEAGKMKLAVTYNDIVSVSKLIYSSFVSYAESKNIEFKFTSNQTEYPGFFDRDKIEKVLYNLLSNAFKFTPNGGSITFRLTCTAYQASFEIQDSGPGIPADQLDKIFNRFYQIDSSTTRSIEGSGIGLALAKELAENHYGTLRAVSEEGSGSTFILELPVDEKRYQGNIGTPEESNGIEFLPLPNESVPSNESIDGKDQLPVVMVAEDNDDMRLFIQQTLADQYDVFLARDGQEAFNNALQIIPDLIVSDLMMPRMDGTALCKSLKENQATSHIPVIMLTAKADIDSKLEGLTTGADDYLTKPFDARELRIRIHNLIEQRKKLRSLYSNISFIVETPVPSREQEFMMSVQSLLEANYGDSEFGMDEFIRGIGMSRMQLHRKMTALTDISPGEYIRKFRLEKAKLQFKAKDIQVSEVAYSVGFNSLSHFTKIFKEYTGKTPTDYQSSS